MIVILKIASELHKTSFIDDILGGGGGGFKDDFSTPKIRGNDPIWWAYCSLGWFNLPIKLV